MSKTGVRCGFLLLLLMIGSSLSVSDAQALFGFTSKPDLVVYTNVPRDVSEPILQEFQKQKGIKIEMQFVEEKGGNLAGLIQGERSAPHADVIWDFGFQAVVSLIPGGLLMPYRSELAEEIPDNFKDKSFYWTGFAVRSSVLIYNSEKLTAEEMPESILALKEKGWLEMLAIARASGSFDLFVKALFAQLGKKETEKFVEGIIANKAIVVDNDSDAWDLVSQGKVLLAFANLNNLAEQLSQESPVKIFANEGDKAGNLLVPNTVGLINRCPHPEKGKLLIDFLLSPEVETQLAASRLALIPLRSDLPPPAGLPDISQLQVMDVNYNSLPSLGRKLDKMLGSLVSQRR